MARSKTEFTWTPIPSLFVYLLYRLKNEGKAVPYDEEHVVRLFNIPKKNTIDHKISNYRWLSGENRGLKKAAKIASLMVQFFGTEELASLSLMANQLFTKTPDTKLKNNLSILTKTWLKGMLQTKAQKYLQKSIEHDLLLFTGKEKEYFLNDTESLQTGFSTRKVLFREAIKKALISNNGEGSLTEIYNYIEINCPEVCDIDTWRDSTRRTLYQHSSDCEIYNSNNLDLFYTVGGISSGYWGLRNFVPSSEDLKLIADANSFPEGKEVLRTHLARERNPIVIRLAKEKFKSENNGRLFCQCCGFNFEEHYGDIGVDFIEGHHIIPVSQMTEGDRTKIEEIALLCSNCHSMIHRKRPWVGIKDLKTLLKMK